MSLGSVTKEEGGEGEQSPLLGEWVQGLHALEVFALLSRTAVFSICSVCLAILLGPRLWWQLCPPLQPPVHCCW